MTDLIKTAINLLDNVQRMIDEGTTQEIIWRYCDKAKGKLRELGAQKSPAQCGDLPDSEEPASR